MLLDKSWTEKASSKFWPYKEGGPVGLLLLLSIVFSDFGIAYLEIKQMRIVIL